VVTGAIVALLALRFAELRTVAHLLYSPELLDLASLAWDADQGRLHHDGSVAGFVATYQYNHFDQGTLLIQALHWLTSRLVGFGTAPFHGVGLLFEAVTIAAVTVLATRIAGLRGLLAVGVLLLAPAFLVAWQLMPYGNHTEFLVVPVLCATAWTRERPPWAAVVALLVAGVVLYRLNGVSLAAFALTALATRTHRAQGLRAAGLAAVAAVAAVGLLYAAWPGDENVDVGLIPRLGLSGSVWDVLVFLGAPRNHLGGWPWRLALTVWALAGASAGLRSGALRPFTVYCLALAGLGLGVPLALAPRAEYMITGVLGLVLLGLPALAKPGPHRLVASAGAALMLLSGFVDATALIGPSTWETTRGFDAQRLHFELGIEDPDVDELPFYRRLLDEGRGSRDLGLATATHFELQCPLQPGRLDPGPLRRADEQRCGGWSPGGLTAHIVRISEGGWSPTTQGLRDFGAGAWIVCQREVACVEESLVGAPDDLRETILIGARAEAARAR